MLFPVRDGGVGSFLLAEEADADRRAVLEAEMEAAAEALLHDEFGDVSGGRWRVPHGTQINRDRWRLQHRTNRLQVLDKGRAVELHHVEDCPRLWN